MAKTFNDKLGLIRKIVLGRNSAVRRTINVDTTVCPNIINTNAISIHDKNADNSNGIIMIKTVVMIFLLSFAVHNDEHSYLSHFLNCPIHPAVLRQAISLEKFRLSDVSCTES